MKLLSILNGHDSNISTYDSETGEFTYTKNERLVNLKHIFGFSDMIPIIPSVVHVDGSSRIQTVSENDNETFFKLLTAFHNITIIPILLNTSLNDGGYPIMGRRDQATEMLKTSDLDVVCVGNNIYYKVTSDT